MRLRLVFLLCFATLVYQVSTQSPRWEISEVLPEDLEALPRSSENVFLFTHIPWLPSNNEILQRLTTVRKNFEHIPKRQLLIARIELKPNEDISDFQNGVVPDFMYFDRTTSKWIRAVHTPTAVLVERIWSLVREMDLNLQALKNQADSSPQSSQLRYTLAATLYEAERFREAKQAFDVTEKRLREDPAAQHGFLESKYLLADPILTLDMQLSSGLSSHSDTTEQATLLLEHLYTQLCKTPSDINEHLPTLRGLVRPGDTVMELGVRHMVATFAFLAAKPAKYIGVDLTLPIMHKYRLAQRLATTLNISFTFLQGNDLDLSLPSVDLMLIDTWHTYQQLSKELHQLSHLAKRYIVLHDTGFPWGFADEPGSSLPAEGAHLASMSETGHNASKPKGLWAAVVHFLQKHPEWVIFRRDMNNSGLTVLKRIQ